MTMRLVLLLSLALVPAAASAAPATAANKAVEAEADAAARKAAAGPVRVYDFDNDTVPGESLRPDHERVDARPIGGRESLIKVRTHFIPQMLHMANDV